MKEGRPSNISKNRIGEIFVLLLIVMGAFFLRFYKIGYEDLWVDEIGHLQAAQSERIPSVLNQVRIHVGAAPLDYLVLRSLLPLIDQSDLGLVRIPYTIYGGISVLLTYILARRFFGPLSGILSAFFLCISPFHIRYSQEVRFYSLSVLLSLLSFICLYSAIKTKKNRSWILWGIISALSFYTFYYFAILYFFQILYIVWIKQREREQIQCANNSRRTIKEQKTLVLSIIVPVLLILPWFIWDLGYPFTSSIVNFELSLDSIVNSFHSVGKEMGGVGIFALFLALALLNVFSDRRGVLFLGILLGSLFGSLFIVSLFGYFFSSRQVLFAIPFFFISVSSGIQTLFYRILTDQVRRKFIIGVMTVCLISGLYTWTLTPILISYYKNSQKPAWSKVAEYLVSEFKAFLLNKG